MGTNFLVSVIFQPAFCQEGCQDTFFRHPAAGFWSVTGCNRRTDSMLPVCRDGTAHAGDFGCACECRVSLIHISVSIRVSSLPTAASVALPSGLREREQLYALLIRETYQIVRMHESFTVTSARKLHVHRGNHTKASLRHAHESFTVWHAHEGFTVA